MRAQNVMDNLIYRREIPVMLGVFINPGRQARSTGADALELGRSSNTNRPTEYNSLDDKYARVITEELLPALAKDYNISKDPEMRRHRRLQQRERLPRSRSRGRRPERVPQGAQ